MKIEAGKMRKLQINLFFVAKLLPFLLVFLWVETALAIPAEEIRKMQAELQGKPTGERIAFWAEQFIGAPYDKDPQGEYVTRAAIVADERVDCMYLTFRAVELALSHTPDEAIQIALDKRFHSRGVLRDGKVVNYEDRFEYGEDMIQSGKWGREITSELGRNIRIAGSRGKEYWEILPTKEFRKGVRKLRSGDIIFFMTPPGRRKVGEAVGHIGIVKVEGESVSKKFYLIHASGTKTKGGIVKKVLLKDYIAKMPFMGVKITRFE
jgi:hypothetical protein